MPATAPSVPQESPAKPAPATPAPAAVATPKPATAGPASAAAIITGPDRTMAEKLAELARQNPRKRPVPAAADAEPRRSVGEVLDDMLL